MNRLVCLLVFCEISGAAFAAAPQVSGVSLSQDAAQRVTISYTLANAPAIITVDVRTNGVSVGDRNLRWMSGDVNRLVTTEGAHTVTWPAFLHQVDEDSLMNAEAVVTAWTTNFPPQYMVVDLGRENDVTYYTSVDALPTENGPTDNVYRVTQMLFRRIDAKGRQFSVGQGDTVHTVTMDHDYYIGVHECTQWQWIRNGMGLNNGGYVFLTNQTDQAGRPIDKVGFSVVRGDVNHPDAPTSSSFLGLLRARTGLPFDLPGEVEWEIAARAGNDERHWNDGSVQALAPDNNRIDTNLNKIARHHFNAKDLSAATISENGDVSGSVSDPDRWVDDSFGTAAVGSYKPNNWGLYDMAGNVWEMCLDEVGRDAKDIDGTIFHAATTAANNILRGGSALNGPGWMTLLGRNSAGRTTTGNYRGFRVALPLASVE